MFSYLESALFNDKISEEDFLHKFDINKESFQAIKQKVLDYHFKQDISEPDFVVLCQYQFDNEDRIISIFRTNSFNQIFGLKDEVFEVPIETINSFSDFKIETSKNKTSTYVLELIGVQDNEAFMDNL